MGLAEEEDFIFHRDQETRIEGWKNGNAMKCVSFGFAWCVSLFRLVGSNFFLFFVAGHKIRRIENCIVIRS